MKREHVLNMVRCCKMCMSSYEREREHCMATVSPIHRYGTRDTTPILMVEAIKITHSLYISRIYFNITYLMTLNHFSFLLNLSNYL